VTKQLLELLSVAPLYVAIEQGFFEKEGIEAEIVSGGGGAQVIASVLSGEAQFAVSGPRSMFTPLDKGEDQSLNSALTYQITLSKQYQKKKNVSKDSSIEDRVASLNGATIGTNLVGDSGDVYTRHLNAWS